MPEHLAWDAMPRSLPRSDGMYDIAVPGNTEWAKRVV